MAKRYHNSDSINHKPNKFNDEKHHDKDSIPAGMYSHSPSDLLGDYSSGLAARRRMEAQNGGMIMENPRAVANLPQEVMMKPYEKVNRYLPEDLEDSIAGVDAQMEYDNSKRAGDYYPKKV